MANVYVARSHDSFGSMVPFAVTMDEKKVGDLWQDCYFLLSLAPGKHVIRVASSANTEAVQLDAQAGKNYFYEVSVVKGGPLVKAAISIVIIEGMGKFMVTQKKRAVAAGD